MLHARRISCRCEGALRALLLLGLTGCANFEPVELHAPLTDPAQVYSSLTLEHAAITLSTDSSAPAYHMVQLTAKPKLATGEVVSGAPAPLYRSSDTTAVRVNEDGIVTAIAPAAGVTVIAELVIGQVRHADTAIVNVTSGSPPPMPLSLSIHPVPPDSLVVSAPVSTQSKTNNFLDLAVAVTGVGLGAFPSAPVAKDGDGNDVPGLVYEYASLDSSVLRVDRWIGFIAGRQVISSGRARLTARTLAYGREMADTVWVTVTPPYTQRFLVAPGLAGGLSLQPATEVRIAPGGLVAWSSLASDSVDIVFDNIANEALPPTTICDWFASVYISTPGDVFGLEPLCGTGSFIMPPAVVPSDLLSGDEPTIRIRRFPQLGTYSFHSARKGLVGKVIVAER